MSKLSGAWTHSPRGFSQPERGEPIRLRLRPPRGLILATEVESFGLRGVPSIILTH
jgi:hypothetical protein